MDIAEDKPKEQARAPKIGPGERLQAERIKKGMSVEDVASRMHLSTGILEAIEENNFDEITAPIFVKGYLRAYARIVSLSEDDMIEQYLEMYSEEDPPISSTSTMVPELSAKDARIKWTTYLVVLVLGVLLAAWWWNKQQNEEAPISLDSQTTDVSESASTGEAVVSSEVQAGSEPLIESADGSETAVVSTQSGDTTAQPDVSQQSEDTTAQEPEPGVATADEIEAADDAAVSALAPEVQGAIGSGEGAQDAATESETESTVMETESMETQAVEAGAVEQEAEAGSLASTESVGPDRLQIIVHADTWADVKDANDNQLVYDLLRADSSRELNGVAPFVVFLGNGHGVEILFNGEEIDITPRIRNDNTARLNVGG